MSHNGWPGLWSHKQLIFLHAIDSDRRQKNIPDPSIGNQSESCHPDPLPLTDLSNPLTHPESTDICYPLYGSFDAGILLQPWKTSSKTSQVVTVSFQLGASVWLTYLANIAILCTQYMYCVWQCNLCTHIMFGYAIYVHTNWEVDLDHEFIIQLADTYSPSLPYIYIICVQYITIRCPLHMFFCWFLCPIDISDDACRSTLNAI